MTKRLSQWQAARIADRLNDRDRSIIATVAVVRIASTSHIRRLHFANGTSRSNAIVCRRTLRRLVATGILILIRRRYRDGAWTEHCYRLGYAGQRIAFPNKRRYPEVRPISDPFIAHMLAVTELYVTYQVAAARGELRLLGCELEPKCWRLLPGLAHRLVKPDMYLFIQRGSTARAYFIEMDMATEAPTRIRDKLSVVRAKPYHFDLDAIRDAHLPRTLARAFVAFPSLQNTPKELLLGRNPGDVWRFAPSVYPGAHFATFPPELVRRPLLASCPEKICTRCNRPWRRMVTPVHVPTNRSANAQKRAPMNYPTHDVIYIPGALLPDCLCNAPTVPGIVLDPFFGSGTVGEVAHKLGRDYIGIELNPAYVRLASERIAAARDNANA